MNLDHLFPVRDPIDALLAERRGSIRAACLGPAASRPGHATEDMPEPPDTTPPCPECAAPAGWPCVTGCTSRETAGTR